MTELEPVLRWRAATRGGRGHAPVALVANVQTGAFWGSHPTAAQLAAYLERGDVAAGPPGDWSVGHFVGLVGLARAGPARS